MLNSRFFIALATCALHYYPLASATENFPVVEQIEVYSDFSSNSLFDLSNSVTVVNSEAIANRNARHLQQVLGVVPNVNYSSGASRGRFFQIRGIGERSQFVDPVNSSVGLIIDGINFTGLGLAANTLDIEQIEVLRGPQGTLFGANALAGLISLQSNRPAQAPMTHIEVSGAEYDSYTVDLVNSGPISDVLRYRFAGRTDQSDGYIENDFLNRNDTNNIDEEVIKLALAYDADDAVTLDLNLYYLNIDNGYDAFSLNNNRRTTSDQPGEDSQETWAGGLTARIEGNRTFNYQVQLGIVDSDSVYAYDEDWSFDGEFDGSLFPYSTADRYERDRDNHSIDLRMASKPEESTQFTFGLYYKKEEEKLTRLKFEDLLVDPEFIPPFSSEFDTENIALYQQTTTPLAEQWSIVLGTRAEYRDASYNDNLNVRKNTYESTIGGRVALEYRSRQGILWYGLISHGYKSGGVNGQAISSRLSGSNNFIPDEAFTFDTETLTNFELGSKGQLLDNQLNFGVTLFAQERHDAQFKQSIFDSGTFQFDDFLSNADAKSHGAELELFYTPTSQLDLYASAGWLDAEFENFVTQSHVDARDDFTPAALDPVNLDGRDIAHAPNYQFAAGTEIRFADGWHINLDIEGKDEFYFSNSHNEKSGKYELYHATLGFRAENWEISLWGRNLTDKDVEERGFYFSNQFGNNPGNGYAPETYTQFGEPRIIGAKARITLD